MFCEKCGEHLSEGQAICPKCSTVNDDNDYAVDTSKRGSVYRDKDCTNYTQQTLNGIKLANEEFVVRTYLCSRLRFFPPCTGYLSVTNRRVLFHGHSGSSRIVSEVPLDAVSGISTLYGGRFSFVLLIAGLIFLGTSAVFFTSEDTVFGICALILGIVLLFFSYRKTFILKLYSSKATSSPIHIGSGAGGGIGSPALFTVSASPTKQTNTMMLELGAMINDLQSMGDYGVEKWRK